MSSKSLLLHRTALREPLGLWCNDEYGRIFNWNGKKWLRLSSAKLCIGRTLQHSNVLLKIARMFFQVLVKTPLKSRYPQRSCNILPFWKRLQPPRFQNSEDRRDINWWEYASSSLKHLEAKEGIVKKFSISITTSLFRNWPYFIGGFPVRCRQIQLS